MLRYKVNGEVLKLTNLRPTVHSFPPLYTIHITGPYLRFARIFADKLSSMSKAQIISVSLFGSPLLSPEQNNDLFFHVQSFISESMRFYKST